MGSVLEWSSFKPDRTRRLPWDEKTTLATEQEAKGENDRTSVHRNGDRGDTAGVLGTALAQPSTSAQAGGLPRCQRDLAVRTAERDTCNANLGAAQQFPATGQTTGFLPGDDGNIQAGATLSYTDNGDGTITDNNTKLMWEKKSDDGGLHDKDNTYVWLVSPRRRYGPGWTTSTPKVVRASRATTTGGFPT